MPHPHNRSYSPLASFKIRVTRAKLRLMLQSPAIGGTLYTRFGWYSPFIFSIIICVIDLVLRLLVLEQRHVAAGTAIPSGRTEEQAEKKELSLYRVIVALVTSPRGMTACSMMFVYGLVLSAMDPT
jgi:MFS family permease